MAGEHITRIDVAQLFLRATMFGVLTYFGIKYMVDAIDPTRKQKKSAKEKAERLLSRLGVSNKDLEFTEYELSIAAQLIDPSTIDVSWKDIAGLSEVIDDIKATVILPIKLKDTFFGCDLHQPPKGVLLHGPPGCGKTMLAKATAKEAGARFINLEVPALTDKWYGESQKLAQAVFTLAVKLEPCIIFIDEIDSFLRSRDSHDHEATAMMKAQFMMLWDGLASSSSCQVIVMGATNRPQDVDKAILRRMPAMFQIGLPDISKRSEMLSLVLKNESIEEDIDLERIAHMTEGFSGSDIRELCRNAALVRVRDFSLDVKDFTKLNFEKLRAITMNDFISAVQKMKGCKVLLTNNHSAFALD